EHQPKQWNMIEHQVRLYRDHGQNTLATPAAIPTEIVDRCVNNAVTGATTFTARPLRIGNEAPVKATAPTSDWRRPADRYPKMGPPPMMKRLSVPIATG